MEDTIFSSPAFVQDLMIFCVGILAGFITSALIRTPRWILAMLNS